MRHRVARTDSPPSFLTSLKVCGECSPCVLRPFPFDRFSYPAQRPEGCAQLPRNEVRLLPGREAVGLVHLVEVDEVGVRLLGPAARRLVELAREDADGAGTVAPLTSKKPSVF